MFDPNDWNLQDDPVLDSELPGTDHVALGQPEPSLAINTNSEDGWEIYRDPGLQGNLVPIAPTIPMPAAGAGWHSLLFDNMKLPESLNPHEIDWTSSQSMASPVGIDPINIKNIINRDFGPTRQLGTFPIPQQEPLSFKALLSGPNGKTYPLNCHLLVSTPICCNL